MSASWCLIVLSWFLRVLWLWAWFTFQVWVMCPPSPLMNSSTNHVNSTCSCLAFPEISNQDIAITLPPVAITESFASPAMSVVRCFSTLHLHPNHKRAAYPKNNILLQSNMSRRERREPACPPAKSQTPDPHLPNHREWKGDVPGGHLWRRLISRSPAILF